MRRRQLAEQKALEAERAAQAQAARTQFRARLDSASTPIPGLPFIRRNTIVVTRNRVVFMYLEPDVTASLTKGDRYGYYVWRWDVTEGVSPFSLVFAADTAMRTTNFGDIVKSSRVRRCSSIFQTAALTCTIPVEAFVTRQGQGFRIEVADSIIYNAMKTAQPRTAMGLTFTPLGRSVAATINVLYVDPNVKNNRE